MLADGVPFAVIKERLQTTAPTISRWKQRFLDDGMEGLDTYHPGQQAVVLTPALRAKILAATRRKPKDGSSHWSCRKLAAAVNVSKDMVHRVWREAGLKPHRLERYMASNDPDFERKAADVIGLYLNPPQHAAVFCVDEKTAIQALDRKDPVLPLAPGRAERHGFETTATARCPCMRPSTRRRAKCWARPPHATPRPNSSPSSPISWRISPRARRSM